MHANRREVTLATPIAALITAMDCKAAIATQSGTKFVAGDGKFMFEYPDRWAVAIVRFVMNAQPVLSPGLLAATLSRPC